jgi:diacylglycerol kinase family enzyme
MTKGVEVIINATAGAGGEALAQTLTEAFASCDASARVRIAREGAEVESLVRRALSNGAGAIVAGGGDGTIAAVASQLVGTHRALGVLPLGTLNHFAKDLGVPLNLEEAARNVCEGRVARVDVGEVNGQVFVNNSSLGLYPRIVRRRDKLQAREGDGKWKAFFRAAFAVLRRYPFLRVRLNADGHEIVRETPFVMIGNNEYEMESFRLGARTCLDAGCLSLYVAHRTGRLGLLRLAVRALFGRLRQAKDFDALRAQEIIVETRRPKRLPIATDGEVNVMTTPLRYRVLPGALRVIVPSKGSQESEVGSQNEEGSARVSSDS